MQYPAHAAFVAPARAYPQLWRLLVGLLLIGAIFILFVVVLFIAAGVIAGGAEPLGAWIEDIRAGGTPTGTLVLLASFLGLMLGPLAAAPLLHRRRISTLFGRLETILRDAALAALIAAPLLAVTLFLPPHMDTTPNLDLSLWLTFLPLTLAVLVIQTGAEELLFRGYIQQQLAARFRSPLIWIGLPAVLFALGHFDPSTYGDSAWLVVAAVGIFALCAADLTARTGSIGAAWGFHFANNVAAVLFVAVAGPLSGVALHTVPAEGLPPETLRIALLRDMAMTIVIWFAIRTVLGRFSRSAAA